MLCWGVRDMKRFRLLQVTSPLVELECGGNVVKTTHIKDTKKNPNFPEPVISMDVVSTMNTLPILSYSMCTCTQCTCTCYFNLCFDYMYIYSVALA